MMWDGASLGVQFMVLRQCILLQVVVAGFRWRCGGGGPDKIYLCGGCELLCVS